MRLNRLQMEAIGRAVGYVGIGWLGKLMHVTDQNAAMIIGVAGELGVLGLAMYQTRQKAVATKLLDMATERDDDNGVLLAPNGGKDAHLVIVPKAKHLAANIESHATMRESLEAELKRRRDKE